MPARRRLDRRALSRALLARQGLLGRRPASAWGHEGVADVLRHLVGMQAQLPGDPYLGLWSRIADFDPATLSDLVADRRVVRIPLMRSTIHAVTADDARLLRPLVQPVIERTTAALERRALGGVDLAELATAARDLVAASPRTPADLDRLLAVRWPGRERGALANAARTHVPLVQVPPRGLWGARGTPTLANLEDWVDQQENIGSVLIDGMVGARWQMRHERGRARLLVDLLGDATQTTLAEVEAEAGEALAFLAPGTADARVEVRSAPSATLQG